MPAAEQCNKIGAKQITLSKFSFQNWGVSIVHFMQSVASASLSTFSQQFVVIPPMIVIRLTVQRSLAGNCDVALLERIDEGGIIQQFCALPARTHRWKIGFG